MKSARWLVGLSLALVACGGSGEQPARSSAAHTDSVELAASRLNPEMFDTIAWPSDSAAVDRGSVVWTYSCRRCHGDHGLGDGGFAQAGDTIRPPSLVEPGWRFANDREGLRQQVFTGTSEGMPHWGLVGLKPRDVDAVALYIQLVLRQR
jgi:mono/diheme cytochrome c family protein